MRALDVAAPSAAVDPLSPWESAFTASDKALAATFWFGFHGLSAVAHAVALLVAFAGVLLPVPLLASMCANVKQVEPIPERVEMAIVEVKPPPPPPPVLLAAGTGDGVALRTCSVDADCARGERCVSGVCVDKSKRHKREPKHRKRAHDDEAVAVFGILAALNSANDHDVLMLTSALTDANEGHALGGLVGSEIGDAFGAGGLGLRGTGVGPQGSEQAAAVGGVEGGVVGGVVGGGVTGGGGGSGGTGSGYGYGVGRGGGIGDALGRGEAETVPPRVVERVDPVYPDALRAAGVEGNVLVRVSVDERGAVTRVAVLRASGHTAFDSAAVDAVRRWRFDPARKGAVAVAGTTTARVRFALE